MNAFDKLYKKIIFECKCKPVVKEDNAVEDFNAYQEKVKELFAKVLREEACDLAGLLFNSEAEKETYIADAAADYLDSIEILIEDQIDQNEFLLLDEEAQIEMVKSAIAENSEAIFGVDIFA